MPLRVCLHAKTVNVVVVVVKCEANMTQEVAGKIESSFLSAPPPALLVALIPDLNIIPTREQETYLFYRGIVQFTV